MKKNINQNISNTHNEKSFYLSDDVMRIFENSLNMMNDSLSQFVKAAEKIKPKDKNNYEL